MSLAQGTDVRPTRRRAPWLVAAVLLVGAGAAGCAPSPAAPQPAQLDPDHGPRGQTVDVLIHGKSFFVSARPDYTSGNSTVDARFEASLGGQPLEQVTYVDSETLRARVPAGLPPGALDLEVVDPAGRRGRLPAAYRVIDGDGGPDAGDAGDGSADGRGDGPPADRCDRFGEAGADGGSDAGDGPGGDQRLDGGAALVARLQVEPPAGDVDTDFTLDARQSQGQGLGFRYDTDGDGVFESPGGPTLAHRFPAPGTYRVSVEVTDQVGQRAYASATVVVSADADRLVVTTGVDESTSPPQAGAGLSLREAIALANQRAGRQLITFAGPMVIQLGSALPTPSQGVDIVGGPGVILDGQGNACGALGQTGVHIYGLEIRNCQGSCLSVNSGVTDFVLESSNLHDCQRGLTVEASGLTIGPDVELSGCDEGIRIQAADVTVTGLRVHDNRVGVFCNLGADRCTVERSLVYGNTEDGIFTTVQLQGVRVLHSTIDGNGGAGLRMSSASGAQIRNNLFSHQGGAGIQANLAAALMVDHNGFYQNAGGGPAGTATVLADPLYLDPRSGDFRLSPGSPAVDAGDPSVGIDVNGVGPGLFDGSAPDLGGLEQ